MCSEFLTFRDIRNAIERLEREALYYIEDTEWGISSEVENRREDMENFLQYAGSDVDILEQRIEEVQRAFSELAKRLGPARRDPNERTEPALDWR
tara:strand:- start:36 stop:320 length:285 start_codon:yes stop_codon:yes gene_type:complete